VVPGHLIPEAFGETSATCKSKLFFSGVQH
jgi:hypothetical protein